MGIVVKHKSQLVYSYCGTIDTNIFKTFFARCRFNFDGARVFAIGQQTVIVQAESSLQIASDANVFLFGGFS